MSGTGCRSFLASAFWLLASAVLPAYGHAEVRASAIRAFGGCLGTTRRRRTWHAAKSAGELRANVDPAISEWGNPPSGATLGVSRSESIGSGGEPGELKHLSSRRKG